MTVLAIGGVGRISANLVLDWFAGFDEHLSCPSLSECYIHLYQDIQRNLGSFKVIVE